MSFLRATGSLAWKLLTWRLSAPGNTRDASIDLDGKACRGSVLGGWGAAHNDANLGESGHGDGALTNPGWDQSDSVVSQGALLLPGQTAAPDRYPGSGILRPVIPRRSSKHRKD